MEFIIGLIFGLAIYGFMIEKDKNTKNINSHRKNIDLKPPVLVKNTLKTRQEEKFQPNQRRRNITSLIELDDRPSPKPEKPVVNNYYIQNNIYIQKEKEKKKNNNSYTHLTKNQKKVKILGDAILESTGSKREAKDILVEKYDFDEKTAKYAVGYSNSSKDNSKGHTYEKWQELGYQVKKGEKVAYRCYGHRIFTPDQVFYKGT